MREFVTPVALAMLLALAAIGQTGQSQPGKPRTLQGCVLDARLQYLTSRTSA